MLGSELIYNKWCFKSMDIKNVQNTENIEDQQLIKVIEQTLLEIFKAKKPNDSTSGSLRKINKTQYLHWAKALFNTNNEIEIATYIYYNKYFFNLNHDQLKSMLHNLSQIPHKFQFNINVDLVIQNLEYLQHLQSSQSKSSQLQPSELSLSQQLELLKGSKIKKRKYHKKNKDSTWRPPNNLLKKYSKYESEPMKKQKTQENK